MSNNFEDWDNYLSKPIMKDFENRPYKYDGFLQVDEQGIPVKHNAITHRYSYDPFVIWQTGKKANNTVWTDHLFRWDSTKHDSLCQKYFKNAGQHWGERDPELIEKFLQDYLEYPNLKLIRIMQHCNVSNGFPLWRFDFIEGEKDE